MAAMTDRQLIPARFYSIKKVAAALDVSEKTVRRMIARGELRAHRVGRQLRIAESDLPGA